MKAFISLFQSGAWFLPLIALLAAASSLAKAETADQGQPVNALTAVSAESLLVLRDGALISVGTGAPETITLPALEADARPSTLVTGADGKIYLGGPGVGVWVYDSVNRSWQSLNDTLPDLQVSEIAAHTTQPETLYAYMPEKGMFRSKDGGAKWVRVDDGPQEPVQAFLHSNMAGSMESGWLFAGTTRGVARSMDCFCFWGDAGDLRGTVTAITFDPAQPENVYVVIDGAIHHSDDGGEAWKPRKAPEAVSALTFSPGKGLIAGTASGRVLAANAAGDWAPLYE
ncbi:hypothetical protein [Marinobacter sp.]|uniref:hypothetical protein n=1 Tax=Marinobacter sp. TaxID=50741 RepID=UPI00384A64E3